MTFEPELRIRKVEFEGFDACARIYADAWNRSLPGVPRQISTDDFKNEVDGELTLVATENGEVVGYISIWEPNWFIHHLYVKPSKHGTGIGSSLVTHAETLAGSHALSLKCQVANTSAAGFYAALGFVEVSERGTDEYGPWLKFVKQR